LKLFSGPRVVLVPTRHGCVGAVGQAVRADPVDVSTNCGGSYVKNPTSPGRPARRPARLGMSRLVLARALSLCICRRRGTPKTLFT
jgi:hypothetical protein